MLQRSVGLGGTNGMNPDAFETAKWGNMDNLMSS